MVIYRMSYVINSEHQEHGNKTSSIGTPVSTAWSSLCPRCPRGSLADLHASEKSVPEARHAKGTDAPYRRWMPADRVDATGTPSLDWPGDRPAWHTMRRTCRSPGARRATTSSGKRSCTAVRTSGLHEPRLVVPHRLEGPRLHHHRDLAAGADQQGTPGHHQRTSRSLLRRQGRHATLGHHRLRGQDRRRQ